MPAKSIIVGTAGHIDHGKTSLVKALTGIDADRLEEEKRRGITIDIGFAHMELDSGGQSYRLGFVDVPGHERFVRNMLAGVGGIDMVLLVVAADEGVMPQTREHFDICRLLSVQRGITVLTKADLVDKETLEVVRMEVEEFVRGSFLDSSRSPVVAVSSSTGDGLPQLRQALAKVASEVQAKETDAPFRLPIDRVFTMKGFGTVVTGTLVSGSVAPEDEVEIFPSRKRARVRTVQVHDQPVERAVAGQRTALNLSAMEKSQLSRGMMLAAPNMFRPSKRFDLQLNLLSSAKPLKNRSRVHLHCFSAETVAEIVFLDSARQQLAPGETVYAQANTQDALLCFPGDHFIVRQLSPVITIGGGTFHDNDPIKWSPKLGWRDLQPLAGDWRTSLSMRIGARGPLGLTLKQLVAKTGWLLQIAEARANSLIEAGEVLRFADVFVFAPAFKTELQHLTSEIQRFHESNPLQMGIGKQELFERSELLPAAFTGALEQLLRERVIEVTGEQVRLAGRGVVMKDEEAEARDKIETAFAKAGLKVPALKEVMASLPVDKTRAQKIVTLLLRERVLVKLGDDLVFHRSALESLREQMAEYKKKSTRIDVAAFKELTGISRKYAIPLLEYLDRERITRRDGDARILL